MIAARSKGRDTIGQYYILEGRQPKLVHNFFVWARWMDTADRRVAATTIGTLRISTVFLGLNHNFLDEGPPVLFETMIFGFDEHDGYQTRCCTWEEAERHHALAKDIAETLVREADLNLASFIKKFTSRAQ
jgi:hypothetical protein